MGPPSFNTIHRHPRFALSLLLTLLLTSLLLLAPRSGDPTAFSWRPKGKAVYVDKDYNPGVAMWGDLRKILDYNEGMYQHAIRERKESLRQWGGPGALNNFPQPNSAFYTMWDFFIPAFSCPFPVSRVGVLGDGGKWVCGFERVIHQHDCIVYSSGVAQESSFEKVILEKSATCKIYGYDFSVENWGPQIRDRPEFKSRISFKPWKLAPKVSASATPPEYSLQGLMKHNGHKFIDILKLDIEGSEFDVLDSLFEEYKGRPLPFGQLQLEIHAGQISFADFLHFWERLEEAGLRPFWTEPNLPSIVFYKSNPDVSEWSFINIRGDHILLHNPEPYN